MGLPQKRWMVYFHGKIPSINDDPGYPHDVLRTPPVRYSNSYQFHHMVEAGCLVRFRGKFDSISDQSSAPFCASMAQNREFFRHRLSMKVSLPLGRLSAVKHVSTRRGFSPWNPWCLLAWWSYWVDFPILNTKTGVHWTELVLDSRRPAMAARSIMESPWKSSSFWWNMEFRLLIPHGSMATYGHCLRSYLA